MSNLFVCPSIRPELDNRLGLSLEEIAVSLEAKFKNVKRRCEKLIKQGAIVSAPVGARRITRHPSGSTSIKAFDTYVLSIEDAKFLVTQYQSKLGQEYCRYLIARETELARIEAGLADPITARRFALQVLAKTDQHRSLEATQSVVIHQAKALTTSQQRNAGVTRENKILRFKIEDLEELLRTLGHFADYKSVKAIIGNKVERKRLSPIGKALTKLSVRLGYDVKKIDDPNYGSVNVYHLAVWDAFAKENPELFEPARNSTLALVPNGTGVEEGGDRKAS